MTKVVDLSGYSFSGKSAVYDLLCEFKGFHGLGKEHEFDLLRVAHGILDLQNALVNNWSPVRSCEAIRAFTSLIDVYASEGSKIRNLFRPGYRYDDYYPGFQQYAESYIKSLIDSKWKAEWPFALNSCRKEIIFLKKLLFRLGFSKSFECEIFLSRPSEEYFISETKKFLSSIFSCALEEDQRLILNNAFEPFYPSKSLRFFDDAKCIVIDRDPRDIYLSAKMFGHVGKNNVGSTVIGHTIQDFIRRYKIYRGFQLNDQSSIYRLNYENLILDYERQVDELILYLGEAKDTHMLKFQNFNPEISIKGVGMWKNAKGPLLADVFEIESELSNFCAKNI